VRVRAASINPLDKMVRNGELKQFLKYRRPFTLGHDVAGVVTRVGAEVTDFKVGDEVYARPRDGRIGTFASTSPSTRPTSRASRRRSRWKRPPRCRWWRWRRGKRSSSVAQVKPGQRALIHAGAGGLGATVVQLAKHLGAFVATTVHTRDVEKVRALGADEVLDYTKETFAERLSGYDLVLDSLGGDNLDRSLSVLKPGGLAISVVGPPDPAFAAQVGQRLLEPVMWLLSRKVRARARALGVRYSFFFMRASGAQLRSLASLYDAGVLRPTVDRTFSFDETLDAMAYVEAGRAKGKVVIKVK
jgi:NADPH:quinone reductase-like Zn-dependent oxidoreductase